MNERIYRIADLILKAAVVLLALALVYFITDYGRKARSLGSILVYYATPTLLLAGLIAALRSKQETRANVAVLLVFTVVPLYAIEGVLQVRQTVWTEYGLRRSVADANCPKYLWNRQVCLLFLSRGEPWDVRMAVEVYKDLIAQGEDVWPALDAMHLRDSLAMEIDGRPVFAFSPGVSNVRTVLCNETGEWIDYTSDERGFNNPPGLHVPDSVTVAIVGDSYAHGWCVPQGSTIGAGVRTRIPATVSLGFHGSGPLTALATLREYAAPLRPDFVVWLYYEGNDREDLRRELRQDLFTAYLDPDHSQGLWDLQPELDASMRDWIVDLLEREEQMFLDREARHDLADNAIGNHPALRWLKLRNIKQAPRRFMEARQPPEELWNEEMMRQLFERAREDVESWGGTLIVGALPGICRFVDGTEDLDHDKYLRVFEDLGVTVVDFTEIFAAHPDPLSVYWPVVAMVHYGKAGHRLVAETLADTIAALQARQQR